MDAALFLGRLLFFVCFIHDLYGQFVVVIVVKIFGQQPVKMTHLWAGDLLHCSPSVCVFHPCFVWAVCSGHCCQDEPSLDNLSPFQCSVVNIIAHVNFIYPGTMLILLQANVNRCRQAYITRTVKLQTYYESQELQF